MGRHGVKRVAFALRTPEEVWNKLVKLRNIDERRYGELSMNLFLETIFTDVVRERREDLLIEELKERKSGSSV